MHQQNLIDDRLFEWSDLKWKPGIVTRVVAGLIGHSRARQASTRSDETIDAPPPPLTPADIEGGKLRVHHKINARFGGRSFGEMV